jgi:23S rRNA (cytidine1920-2'-O)/16S rRNA (cytidine1409-2'-O)-methyltransferase
LRAPCILRPRFHDATSSNAMAKTRVDLLLVERGLAPSRARAQALVLAGKVRSAGQPVAKPGDRIDDGADLTVMTASHPYVSRGGEKLAHALDDFASAGLDVANKVALDVGAAAGGFTDCLLRRGTSRVYAVDVGYGQLAYELRIDPRVVVRERTNARSLTRADFPEPIDLVVIDASFIGLAKLMPAVFDVLKPAGELLALVKPQFEAGRHAVSRGRGVVRDPVVRGQAIDTARHAIEATGFRTIAESDSALPGPKGNVEHFVYAVKEAFACRS